MTKTVYSDGGNGGTTLADVKVGLEKKKGKSGSNAADDDNRRDAPVIGALKSFNLPKLGAIPSDPKEAIEARKRQVAEIAEVVKTLVVDIAARVDYLRAARVDRATAEACAEDIAMVEGQLNEALAVEDVRFRGDIRRAFALALVKTCPPVRHFLAEVVYGREMQTTQLPGLAEIGILAEIGENEQPALWAKLPVFVDRRPVTLKFKVDEGKIGQELTFQLRHAAQRVADAGREFFASKREELEAARASLIESGVSEITVQQLLSKQPGYIVLVTPDRTVDVRGEQKIYGGGVGLYRSDGSAVWPVAAIGKFEKIMTEVVARKRSIAVNLIGSARFQPSRRIDGPEFTQYLVLHQALYHGIAVVMNAERVEKEKRAARERADAQFAEERDQFAALATTDFVSFFLDEATVGKVFVDFSGVDTRTGGIWTVESREESGKKTVVVKYDHIYVVVERNAEGEVSAVFPERLAPLFDNELASPKNPGVKFANLTYPWGAFLRTCFANAVWRKKQAEKAAASAVTSGQEQVMPPPPAKLTVEQDEAPIVDLASPVANDDAPEEPQQ